MAYPRFPSSVSVAGSALAAAEHAPRPLLPTPRRPETREKPPRPPVGIGLPYSLFSLNSRNGSRVCGLGDALSRGAAEHHTPRHAERSVAAIASIDGAVGTSSVNDAQPTAAAAANQKAAEQGAAAAPDFAPSLRPYALVASCA